MSASFHLAQRGVVLSGNYGADEIVTVPEGAFGVTKNGTVWQNKDVAWAFKPARYPAYWASDDWKVYRGVDKETKERYASETVGFSKSLEKAKDMAARRVFKKAQSDKPAAKETPVEGGLRMPKGTYNDGSFTYDVKGPNEAYVPETDTKFSSSGEPTGDRWTKFVNDLNTAYDAGTLKKGKAPAKTSSSSSSYTPPPAVAPATLAPVETPFYKAKWFLPAVAGGTVLIVLAIALWPKKKKDSAPVVYLPAPAPVPVPVPAPVVPTLPAPQVI